MNERVKKLAEQARKHFSKTETSGEFWVFDEEKFAKLIIQECITAVQNTPKHCAFTTFQEGIVDCTVEMSVQSIKQHFNLTNDSK